MTPDDLRFAFVALSPAEWMENARLGASEGTQEGANRPGRMLAPVTRKPGRTGK